MARPAERRAQLAAIDRRTWHLWGVTLSIELVLVIAISFLFYPAMRWGVDRIETLSPDVLPQLVIGLLTLVFLGASYVVVKQRELNEMRAFILSAYGEASQARDGLPQDALTGVTDRRALPDILKLEAMRADRYGSPLSLVLFDIHGFRAVNAKEGNLAGDVVLKELAQTIQATVRKTDVILRYGPDQFICFLSATARQGAEVFGQRVRKACEKSARLRGLEIDVALAVYERGQDVEALLAGIEHDLKATRAATPAPAAQPA